MRTLDIPVMAILENRIVPPAAIETNLVELMPPAQLLAGLRHPPEVALRKDLSVEPAGDEGDYVIFIRGCWARSITVSSAMVYRRDPGRPPDHGLVRRHMDNHIF